MPEHMRQVTEVLQAQSYNLERVPSNASSLSTGIVDPNRMVKPHHRRANLPALPDLRFEQSYLASISTADTWGRVAWITIRDQVRRHA